VRSSSILSLPAVVLTKYSYFNTLIALDNNNIQEKYFDKSEFNISERLKA
jgi:hypothetical protein